MGFQTRHGASMPSRWSLIASSRWRWERTACCRPNGGSPGASPGSNGRIMGKSREKAGKRWEKLRNNEGL